MSVFLENWDARSTGALSATDWPGDAGLSVVASGDGAAASLASYSGAHAVRPTSASVGATRRIHRAGAADAGTGNVLATAMFSWGSHNTGTTLEVHARIVAGAGDWLAISCYHATLDRTGSVWTVQLFRRAGGASVAIGPACTLAASLALQRWYRLSLRVEATAVSAALEDTVAGTTLHADGDFRVGSHLAVSGVDASPLTGVGLAGIGLNRKSTADYAWVDDVELQDLASDTTPPTVADWETTASGDGAIGSLDESGCTPATGSGGFTLAGTSATVDSWAIEGTTITLALAGAITAGEAVTLSYTAASAGVAIRDAAGNPLADFTAAAVSNTTSSTLTPGAIEFVSSGPGGITLTSATDATGGDGALSYQWRRSEGGGAFADLAGKQSAGLGLDTTAVLDVAYRYLRRVTDGVGNAVDTTPTGVLYRYDGGAIGGGGGAGGIDVDTSGLVTSISLANEICNEKVVTGLYLQMHSGPPSRSGDQNISANSQRKPLVFNDDAPASAGEKRTSQDVTWANPAAGIVAGFSVWSAATGGAVRWTWELPNPITIAEDSAAFTIPAGTLVFRP